MQGPKQKKQEKLITKPTVVLAPIPDKLYFTIGEVSELCQLKTHVLRYWEKEFSQLSPSKRRGNRRYYQRKDILMVRQIRDLLYEQGYTIEGARSKLATENISATLPVTELIRDLEQVLKELTGRSAAW